MKRIMILGGSGSGKSTLARLLGDETGLPVYHMDHILWQAGWVPRPHAQRCQMARDIECSDAWIFEGGFAPTIAHRLSRADTVIWLDLGVGLRLWRVTKRLVRFFGRRRPDMPEGCVEGIRGETLLFYKWIWDTRQTSRTSVSEVLENGAEGTGIVHLRSRRDVSDWVKDLKTNHGTPISDSD